MKSNQFLNEEFNIIVVSIHTHQRRRKRSSIILQICFLFKNLHQLFTLGPSEIRINITLLDISKKRDSVNSESSGQHWVLLTVDFSHIQSQLQLVDSLSKKLSLRGKKSGFTRFWVVNKNDPRLFLHIDIKVLISKVYRYIIFYFPSST